MYNKNDEDPAYFILRLKSLEKAVPTYDLAGSSNNSIPQNQKKSTISGEKISNERKALLEIIGKKDIKKRYPNSSMKSSPMQPSNKLLKESFEEMAKGKIALFYFDKKEPALEFQRERS